MEQGGHCLLWAKNVADLSALLLEEVGFPPRFLVEVVREGTDNRLNGPAKAWYPWQIGR
jgi:hypothetical protein